MSNYKIIKKKIIESFINEIFEKVGLDSWQSKIIARHLVLASLKGVDSHGITRTPIYVKRIKEGLINKEFNIHIERETSSTALINANNTSGIPAATEGIKLAVKKAKETGIGLVGIKNSNHCGMLSDYTEYAASNDCIALATTNAPANMAPWGGKERFFGTNPLSYGIPAGERDNIIFDMATSVVAKGKIINAQKNNETIPLGWAISKEGKETTDVNEALEGLCLPVGGPKGYGLALLVDILSGLFTGASYGPHIGDLFTDFEKNQNVGQFFFVTQADLFQSIDDFKSRIDQMVDEIKQVPLAENIEKIYLPGEIEQAMLKERKENGIPISTELIQKLEEIAIENGISIDSIKKNLQ